MNKLPDKPSELIRVAIADLEKCEADPRYEVYMNSWHTRHKPNPKCSVCFAGVTMAKTLEVDIGCDVFPEDFDKDTKNKLQALDYLRSGQIHRGVFTAMDIQLADGPDGQDFTKREEIRALNVEKLTLVPPYEENPHGFKQKMLEIADELAVKGL